MGTTNRGDLLLSSCGRDGWLAKQGVSRPPFLSRNKQREGERLALGGILMSLPLAHSKAYRGCCRRGPAVQMPGALRDCWQASCLGFMDLDLSGLTTAYPSPPRGL